MSTGNKNTEAITAVQFADQSGFKPRDRFAVNKMYGNALKTRAEWNAELEGKFVINVSPVASTVHATSPVGKETPAKSSKSNRDADDDTSNKK